MSWKSRHKAYLLSPEWALKRQEIFDERGKACEECGVGERLHVHHLTYANLGNEPLEDLQILCADCHRASHGLGSHFTEPGGAGCFMMPDSYAGRIFELTKIDVTTSMLLHVIIDKCNGGDNWVKIDIARICTWMSVSRSTAYRLLRTAMPLLVERKFIRDRTITKIIKGEPRQVRQVITIGVKNIKAAPGDKAAWEEKYNWDTNWTDDQRIAWNKKYGEDPNNGKPNPLNGGFCCPPKMVEPRKRV